ncbi:ubiquitin-like protein [Sistotremastrum niveocremeum HHB9708]|uniref:Ubiquitin-like protein n=1 Tax=Sistotremastrum niveocremeum HHB9708 TaxID=1314777 RepID=A0A164Q0P1_9AGAM|nr:ubiquitin-like protein [Sistotremastrum niveocremeum HHB9708]
MRIFVKTVDNVTDEYEVTETETVDSLKIKIERKKSIPPNGQRLIGGRRGIEDGHALSEYRIMQDSTIHMVLRILPMQIFVKTTNGKSITLNVQKTDTIDSVKSRIADRLDAPKEGLNLIYGSKPLQDAHSLEEYDIGNLATLHMVMRLPGGRY